MLLMTVVVFMVMLGIFVTVGSVCLTLLVSLLVVIVAIGRGEHEVVVMVVMVVNVGCCWVAAAAASKDIVFDVIIVLLSFFRVDIGYAILVAIWCFVGAVVIIVDASSRLGGGVGFVG